MADGAPPRPAGLAGAAPAYRDAVLGPLFAAQKHHNALYRRIDRAHAVMLAEQGILPRPDAVRLLAALGAIEPALQLDSRADAGGFEDLFFLREDAIRQEVGAELAGRLHTGRSRNDLEATIFRLQLKARMAGAMTIAGDLAATVLRLARREAATPILAYTHGQPAHPTTYGHYLAAFGEVLLRDLARLEHALGISTPARWARPPSPPPASPSRASGWRSCWASRGCRRTAMVASPRWTSWPRPIRRCASCS
jgi:argininosuccinate lyase